jgi:hypothetical protein
MQTDDLFQAKSSFRTGELNLWLAVTIDAFLILKDGFGNKDTARDWIEDPYNVFFEAVCEEIGFAPDAFGERIREALRRGRK